MILLVVLKVPSIFLSLMGCSRSQVPSLSHSTKLWLTKFSIAPLLTNAGSVVVPLYEYILVGSSYLLAELKWYTAWRCRVLDRAASSLTEKIPFLIISSKSCSFFSSLSATFLMA